MTLVKYAILNENDVCNGVVEQTALIIKPDTHIIITGETSQYLWHKYDHDNKTWSEETYEPESDVPLTEFQKVQKKLSDVEKDTNKLKKTITDLKLGEGNIAIQEMQGLIDDLTELVVMSVEGGKA